MGYWPYQCAGATVKVIPALLACAYLLFGPDDRDSIGKPGR